MEIRRRITAWYGWRRYGPTAGSVVVNLLLIAMFAGSLAASGKGRVSPPRVLTIELIDVLPPPPPTGPAATPDKPRKSAPPLAARIPDRAARDADRKAEQAAIPPTAAASPDEADGVYLGPPPLAKGEVPRGLKGLLAVDPCTQTSERVRSDCKLQWAKLMIPSDALTTPSLEELAEMYPGFQPPPGLMCSPRLGCTKTDEPWTSLIGTRSFGLKSPMASGPGSLGGMNDMVGRLPPPNPYHVDPGFGD